MAALNSETRTDGGIEFGATDGGGIEFGEADGSGIEFGEANQTQTNQFVWMPMT